MDTSTATRSVGRSLRQRAFTQLAVQTIFHTAAAAAAHIALESLRQLRHNSTLH